jgi:hypothetical protein
MSGHGDSAHFEISVSSTVNPTSVFPAFIIAALDDFL